MGYESICTYKHALYDVISLPQLYLGIYKRYDKLSVDEILFNFIDTYIVRQ